MPKFIRSLFALALLLPTLALAAPTPMRLLESYPSTDVINVGANTIGALSTAGGGEGTLVLSGVSGTVNKAWLYWKGIEYVFPEGGFVGGNGTYDEAEIRFDGQLIIGTQVAANGNVDCHPSGTNIPDSGVLYRADVTPFVQARGNGSYAFSGLSDGLESVANDSDAHTANGLSMVVYFADGFAANDRRVDHYEGQLSNVEGQWDFPFPLDYIGGTVDIILHVSDGQQIFNLDGLTEFSTRPGRQPGTAALLSLPGRVFPDNLPKYAGLSVPSMNHNGGRTAGLWDIRRVPLSSLFTRATRYSTKVSQHFEHDCVSLQVAQVLSAPSPEAAMLTPVEHDFGDIVRQTQSPAQTFTFTNRWPYALAIQNPPLLSSNADTSNSGWYRVVSQNCSGQTLLPGASCSFDLACRPPTGTSAGSLPSAHVRLAWTQVQPSAGVAGEVYSVLRCSGVPTGVFSRLEFAPRACFLTDTAINSTAELPALQLRNTGGLALTITAANINNANGGSALSMLSSTCAIGRVLAPNESCEIRALFTAPNAATISSGSASVNYSAADIGGSGFVFMQLEAPSVAAVPSTGEVQFKNGFEFGVAQCLE